MNSYKLPPEKVAELKQTQRALHDLSLEYDKLEDCGTDCKEYRRMIQEGQDSIEKLLKHFG